MTSVGENIKKTRNKFRITQEELAEKINVTRQAVSNWENGKTEPDIETLTKIAQIFDISIDELVDGIPTGIKELRGKKSHLYAGIIFTALYLVLTLFYMLAKEPVHDYVSSTYKMMQSFILVYILRPVSIVFGGIGISAFVAYGTGFYVKNKNFRNLLILIGTLLFLLTTGYLFYIFAGYVVAYFNTYGPKLFLGSGKFLVSYPFVNIIGPIFLSFGIINNKK